MEEKAMANEIVYRTEDEVRDSAKIQLGFDKTEANVKQGTGQITTFNQLGFKGVMDKPDGWYLPDDCTLPAIILETKSEVEDISLQKWADELIKNCDIVSKKYKNTCGILYNGIDIRVFKNGTEVCNAEISNVLQNKSYYLSLFTQDNIDIGELFDIHPTKAYKLTNSSLMEEDGVNPIVVNSSFNNGIGGYTNQENTEKGGIITFSDTTSADAIFFQETDFVGYPHVQGMYPIGKYKDKWSKYSLLFFVSVFRNRALGLNYDYVNKFTRESAKQISIKLPVDETGNPDFSYMESYMKNLELAVSSSLTDLQSAKKFDISGKLDISSWKLFQISELFNVQKGKRLTKSDMKDGKIRFIGASAINNGITAYISNDEHLHPQNTITLSYNGSIGEAFYQDEMFWASDDVNVLYPKFEMNREMALFMIPLLKTAGKRYAFIDKWKKEDMEKSKIPLPADKDGNPDYKYIDVSVNASPVPFWPVHHPLNLYPPFIGSAGMD